MVAIRDTLLDDYQRVRSQSLSLCKNLSVEDMTAQSMPDASPIKWHLAHTSWFFETFILAPYAGLKAFDPVFQQLFNSYYVSLGQPYARPQRGLITRPSVQQVIDYRAYVDEHMNTLLGDQEAPQELVTVGLHHEMQHQELMLTDILHLFSHNPQHPAAIANENTAEAPAGEYSMSTWLRYDAQQASVGAGRDDTFSYDCEQPRHQTFLNEFSLASRLVSNAEWLEFIQDGGYQEPLLWLSDAWAHAKQQQWETPAYWVKKNDAWFQFGLDGLKKINPFAPVCHISYYEAQAYATWAGKRLPREHELESVTQAQTIHGNFVESKNWRPQPATGEGVRQLYGDVWEWTESPFTPYPGFRAEQGALGEYNGKFMCNQFVLKGGSCATAKQQMRASYRNFFYPHQRWQFSGLRLAADPHQETI